MAGAKVLKKRIESVKNTKKITKTMEMVSTAKSRRMMDRVNAAKPYGEKLLDIMGTLSSLGDNVESPYLRRVDNPKKVALLVVTANRGLCGGYNSNILKLARNRIKEYEKQNTEVELHVIGKKGISYFKFIKVEMHATYLSKEDKIEFIDADQLADHFMTEFRLGRLDRVELISTVYISSATQKPAINAILPVGITTPSDSDSSYGEEEVGKTEGNAIFEPAPEVILQNLIPHLIKSSIYRFMLESAAAEQIYRRVAMKSATDAANDMGKILKRTYNRVRQASITQELSEIVAGADAVG